MKKLQILTIEDFLANSVPFLGALEVVFFRQFLIQKLNEKVKRLDKVNKENKIQNTKNIQSPLGLI
jgi:hypothetical protein